MDKKSKLSEDFKNTLLKALFYGADTQFTSIKKLYEQVKKRGITYNEVRDFVKSQEATQLFMRPKRIKNYFPIVAKHKYEILQVDLLDLSNIAAANENYKYLLICIDVFSRQAFVVPLKNRNTEIVTDALNEVVEITVPTSITSDNEFSTHLIKKFLNERGIDLQTVDVGEHHKLGIVDRFCRTIREKINKYMTMYNTRKYIDVLPKLISNYNSSYHSGVKKAPNDVEEEDESVIQLTNKRYNKAKADETVYNVGDKVRFIINKQQFEKGTLPHWSKTTHSIVSKNAHSYKLDNDKTYKYYELQLVDKTEDLGFTSTEPTFEQMKKDRTSIRRFNKEGLDKSVILD